MLQALYRVDLNPEGVDAEEIERFMRSRLLDKDDLVEFGLSLFNGVQRNRQELDELLAAKAANWSLNRMAATDRNVMRLAAYEILFTETPGPVAINEAVELARRFGSAQSSQFVNGILDRLLKNDSGPGSASDD